MSSKKTEEKSETPTGVIPSLEEQIIEGLTEIRDFLRNGEPIKKKFTIHRLELDLEPQHYDAAKIRATRDMLNVSQQVFALLLAVSVDLVRKWESGERIPKPIACRLLDQIRQDPTHWLKMLSKQKANA